MIKKLCGIAIIIGLVWFFMTNSHTIANAKPIKVAVIDTGSPVGIKIPVCKGLSRDFTKTGVSDSDGHGTNIAYTINKIAKNIDYCQIPIKYYGAGDTLLNSINALKYAHSIGAHIINYSGGGLTEDAREEKIIKKLLDKGVIIVAAAGNEAMNLNNDCNYYPACYDKRIVVVGNLDKNTKLPAKSSNYGNKVIDIWKYGNSCLHINKKKICLSGTSQATAKITGKFIKMLAEKRKPNNRE